MKELFNPALIGHRTGHQQDFKRRLAIFGRAMTNPIKMGCNPQQIFCDDCKTAVQRQINAKSPLRKVTFADGNKGYLCNHHYRKGQM